MRYYTKNNELYANPSDTTGMVEVESPVRDDGSILPNHKNLGQLEVDAEDKHYKYYKQDGTPDHERMEAMETHKNQSEVNTEAMKYLADTDWYVTRLQELGTKIPAEVSRNRQKARKAIKPLPEVV